ncbi:dynamin family protein [Fictibacillus sp. 26RED30]|uniref:dynamin family protein n=1 Tax=Fictibacillus sp. 26RED30 TaxID=2745877 RepID=UPI0018CC812A|nr:dynamin family protein [Fictibacillus sp. 26RED30]MBH0160843.1 dynamin family protein [Fictibacillus sp. 26RED30]
MKSTEKELLITEKQRLIGLYEAFQKMNNRKEEEQLSKLFLKVAKEEFAIAFCGHFSAGKSSLINALSQTGILPSSPIPTSANIVKMVKGEEKAVVQLKSKEVVTFEHPYDVNEIKELCKDAELVEAIEIYYGGNEEDTENIAYYDTPGIDSTDPLHKKATENVVYLADLIFYVMDYNHILSETNIAFISSLIQRGKDVRLIVNQIDKHREEELKFTAFKENVFDSFQSHGIPKEHIFFTSVKKQNVAHNDLTALMAYIKRIEQNKDALLLKQVNNQLQHFVHDYVERTEEGIATIDVVSQRLASFSKEHEDLLKRLSQKEQVIIEKEESVKNQLVNILESAQLMPYETRESAGLFIESAKKDFKVGIFFSKQKTEQERNDRTKDLSEKLQKSIDAHINWHAQNYVSTLQKEVDHNLPDWEPVKVNKEMLHSFVTPGLSAQGQGLLNYCNNISNEVKRLARHQITNCINSVKACLNIKVGRELSNLKEELNRLEDEIKTLQQEKEIAENWDEQKHELHEILYADLSGDRSVYEFERKFLAEFQPLSIEMFKKKFEKEPIENLKEQYEEEHNVTLHSSNDSLLKETEKLSIAASILKPIRGLSHLASEMEELQKRLDKRSFTMVLFGAFSAGKSSFANALFGESILPSSPNPTTAAINEIRCPDRDHHHGSIMIEMKSEEELKQELNNVLKTTDKELNDLLDSSDKELASYKAGYAWAREQLGNVLNKEISEIGEYAADETKACFIKKITIYYSCPLTEKGLVLVDTPGANSIHSRHTEVAFEYMKHADIIIYLTYFNHAFSYADREFLIQLGRIKDTFSSDKMFFAINAADLAETEEDKNDVVHHVKSNLLTFGIRNPRLFPVSSKNELIPSKRAESGFDAFSSSLTHYIEHELENAMIKSARSSLKHASAVIENMIKETVQRMEKEDEYLESLQKRENTLVDFSNDYISISKKQFLQEQKELLYYIKQRVLIRYHDFYKETIHPAAVQNSKNALAECIRELHAKISHDLHQEFKACSLRLDHWIQKEMKDKMEHLISKAAQEGVSLQERTETGNQFKTPSFSLDFENKDETKLKKWLSYFKNPKQFFEQSGSNELKNHLVDEIDHEVENWLVEADKKLTQHYEDVLVNTEKEAKTYIVNQVVSYFEELKKPGDLEAKIQELNQSLSKFEQLEE